MLDEERDSKLPGWPMTVKKAGISFGSMRQWGRASTLALSSRTRAVALEGLGKTERCGGGVEFADSCLHIDESGGVDLAEIKSDRWSLGMVGHPVGVGKQYRWDDAASKTSNRSTQNGRDAQSSTRKRNSGLMSQCLLARQKGIQAMEAVPPAKKRAYLGNPQHGRELTADPGHLGKRSRFGCITSSVCLANVYTGSNAGLGKSWKQDFKTRYSSPVARKVTDLRGESAEVVEDKEMR
ncbi:hypothetical protein C8R45DRAFT_946743 [Mycena sanguinolenta]|nr:hypothetical protein C8R45DRAFT_946743 [Mycena sanguinolenta]